jgi:hypothetical protein
MHIVSEKAHTLGTPPTLSRQLAIAGSIHDTLSVVHRGKTQRKEGKLTLCSYREEVTQLSRIVPRGQN